MQKAFADISQSFIKTNQRPDEWNELVRRTQPCDSEIQQIHFKIFSGRRSHVAQSNCCSAEERRMHSYAEYYTSLWFSAQWEFTDLLQKLVINGEFVRRCALIPPLIFVFWSVNRGAERLTRQQRQPIGRLLCPKLSNREKLHRSGFHNHVACGVSHMCLSCCVCEVAVRSGVYKNVMITETYRLILDANELKHSLNLIYWTRDSQ